MNKSIMNKQFRCLLLASGLFFWTLSASATAYPYSIRDNALSGIDQQQATFTIKGTIVDVQGEPVIGATIQVKGSTTGTITDIDGNFSLNVSKNSTLQITYIGYITQEIVVRNATKLRITLAEDTKTLDEVVVIGFGTTSVRKNSASVTTVNTKAIKEIPFSDMASALQGRVAGVIVQQGSAEPGQNGASISIRGNGDPLYVIDGFISSEQRFLSLNKTDIKSTTVLKDAASTAVYGMNAGNGVILVTTKEGEAGKLNIDYQANFAFNSPSYPTERMNAYDYAYAINNLNKALGQGVNSFKSPEEMNEISQNLGQYTNWEDVCMKASAPQNEHTLSLSGGTERLKFFGSLNYLGQKGITKGAPLTYDRYNYRSNVSSHFDEIGLTVGFNINGSMRDEKYPGAGSSTIYSRMKARNPFEKPFNEDGTLSNQFDNPMMILQGPGYAKLRTTYNQVAVRLNWDMPWVKGWSFGFDGNYNVESQDQVSWNEKATYYDEEGNATVDEPSNISIGRSSYANSRYDFNVRTDYKVTLAEKHDIQATLIHTRQYYHGTDLSAGSNTFYTTTIQQIQSGSAASVTAKNTEGEQASIGYVGRFRYSYDNRYMVEFSGRYDGSDNFPSNKRYGFFPSVSAGWAISEERFFEPLKEMKILDYLKIRGSYGQVGINGADHKLYAYLSTYNYNSNAYVIDGKLVNSVTPGATPSINMTWYTNTKYDIGIDFSTLNNKLEGSLDWFFEKTKGFLAAPKYEYTAPIGYDLPLEVSDAEDRLEGLDGSLKYTTRFGKVDFSAGFNFTYFRTVSAKTNEDKVKLSNPYTRDQGKRKHFVETGYVGTQFYTTPEDVLNHPKQSTSKDLRPGDLWYQDVNGDGQINGQDNRKFGRNTTPSFVFGFDLSAGYKGLNIMANIQGTGHRQTYFSGYAQGSEGERRLNFKYQNDFWTPENRDATLPRLGNMSVNNGDNYDKSDFWAMNTNYVRLKSLTISYDFKHSVLRNESWLRNLTVFASGVNLFAFGPSVKYGDPEANNFDGYAYPMMRTYSLGFQLGF